jgi:RHS repeat-associated protein
MALRNDTDFKQDTLQVNETKKPLPRLGEAGRGLYEENGSSIQNPVSSIRFQYDNHLGSACLELDINAAIISYEEYHPFGTTSYRSGRTQTEVSLKRYKYVGKERDEETGLYYCGARYYAGWIARFVSVDPLQHKYPHYTPYQYAGNKPISYIDLDGMEEAEKNQTDIPKTSVRHGEIVFFNKEAIDATKTKQALENKETELQESTGNAKGLKKEIKKLEKKLESEISNAIKIDEALTNILKADNLGLIHSSRGEDYGFKDKSSISPIQDISNWGKDNAKVISIELSIDIIPTTSNGLNPGASTRKTNETPSQVAYSIIIDENTMNADWALGNEIGDIYFQTVMKSSSYMNADDSKITKMVEKGYSKRDAHNFLYKNDKLFSKKISSYFESLFHKRLK